MDKTVSSAREAVADVKDGSVIAVGGFFAAGVPRTLLQVIIEKGIKNITLACGTGALRGAVDELNQLVENKQLKKVIDSYGLARSMSSGLKDPFEQAVRAGEIELEIYPMGTLAEKYRAAGSGIPAFYMPTGVGSVVEKQVISNMENTRNGKREIREIDGRNYILEYALKTDFAFIHAYIGDTEGNLRYRKTALNFNHVMAKAGKITIAEVEKLVEPGELKADDIQTPGIYIKRIVQVPKIEYMIGID